VTQAALIPVACTIGADFKPQRGARSKITAVERLEADVVTLELVALATMTATFSETFVLEGTPAGGGTSSKWGRWPSKVSGCATPKGRAAADWLVVGPDGTGTLDVRALVEDARRCAGVRAVPRPDRSGRRRGRSRVRGRVFGDRRQRYRWLNKIQAVGKGTFDGTTLTYELFELV
jgi:hypothetical protein